MSKRKYTLPRHTNLASQGARIGAGLIDIAIAFLVTLIFFVGLFRPAFSSTLKPNEDRFFNEQFNSNLRFYDKDGYLTELDKNASFEEFRDTLSYYYMNYLTGENISDGKKASENALKTINVDGVEISKKDYYTVSWFNKNILSIGEDPDSELDKGYFTYVKNNGVYDKSVIGIIKEGKESEANIELQRQLLIAFSDFNSQDYVVKLSNTINFLYSLEFVLAACFGITVTYILIPYLIKNGITLGKKAFGLALANKEGYILDPRQLFMRAMPLWVVCLSLLIPIWDDIFFVLAVWVTVGLVSFALQMASPKRMSLHDYVSSTIVVDFKSSILFKDSLEEEEYLFKEDGIKEENNEDEVVRGEEPDISYEK